MCRSKSEGGRRCSGGTAARDSGQRESYEGTPWQGYDEYMQRSAELGRRVANGESITDIMREKQAAAARERIEQIVREGR